MSRQRTHRMSGRAATLVVTLALTGCAGEDEELMTGSAEVVNMDPQPMFPELVGTPMSPDQESALADGVVTEDEYLAGFERFRARMRDGGFGVERHGPIMIYGYSEESRLAGFADECYWREWQELDASWQIGHPDATEDFEAYNYCLQLAGHSTGTTMDEVERLFAEAGLERRACFDRWQQDGMSWHG